MSFVTRSAGVLRSTVGLRCGMAMQPAHTCPVPDHARVVSDDGPVCVRLVRVGDARRLVDALTVSRDHLADSFPAGWAERLDVEVQKARISRALAGAAEGTSWPGVIVSGSGELLGRVGLNGIVRDNQLSCFLNYWLSVEACGHGYATAAVQLVLDVAFNELGLHRVEAFVRPANTKSLAVLDRAGFERIGMARRHTFVGPDWQDEVLLQRLAPWDSPGRLSPP